MNNENNITPRVAAPSIGDISTGTTGIDKVRVGGIPLTAVYVGTNQVYRDNLAWLSSITVTIPSAGYTLQLAASDSHIIKPGYINWGDGTTTVITSASGSTHKYTNAGTYTITGEFTFGAGTQPTSSMKACLTKVNRLVSTVNHNLNSAFYGCTKLTSAYIDGYNKKTITDFQSTFYGCTSLTSVSILYCDLSSSINCANMFYNCNSLNNLSISSGKADSAINNILNALPTKSNNNSGHLDLYITSGLTALPAAGLKHWFVSDYFYLVFDTSTTYEYYVTLQNDLRGRTISSNEAITFWGDGTVDSSLKHEYTTDGSYMIVTPYTVMVTDNATASFSLMSNGNERAAAYYGDVWTAMTIRYCYHIPENITNFQRLFEEFRNLEAIYNMNKFPTSPTNTSYMFSNCGKLSTIDISRFNFSNVTDMRYMFSWCEALKTITGISNLNTSNVTNMDGVFCSANSITSLDLSKWVTSNVTSMGNLFSSAGSLTSINVSTWNTSKVTDMNCMFEGVPVTTLDLRSFNTSKVTDMSWMFIRCTKLTKILVNSSRWVINSDCDTYNMFYNAGCTSVTYG